VKKRKGPLTPEEQMEQLLKGANIRAERETQAYKDSQARDERFAAAADAAKSGGSDTLKPNASVAAAAAAAAAKVMAGGGGVFNPGDQVEVFGLQSESGRRMNGKKGVIVKFDNAKMRFQVELGLGGVQSLKPDNLRKCWSILGDPFGGSSAGYTML